MLSVGDRIKKIRGALTQKDFADSLGITAQAVINYERHGRVPNRSVLNKISTIYSVPVDWLLYGFDAMSQSGVSEEQNDRRRPFQDMQHNEIIDADKKNGRHVGQNAQTASPSWAVEGEKSAAGNRAYAHDGFAERCMRLADENAALLRQNGDLRVENAELRARVRELERELREALMPESEKAPVAHAG